MPHDKTRQAIVGQSIRKLPVSVFQVGVADVGLVVLQVSAKGERVRTAGPGSLIAYFIGIADKLGVGEVAESEVPVRVPECADSAFRLRQLLHIGSEVVKLRNI